MPSFSRLCPLLFLVLGLAASSSAQVICLPNFPADSPIVSYSPDDIPPTGDHILTYTGAHAAGQANHNLSFIQTNANEQKVWFFTDNTSLDHEHVYYNHRYRANASSPWYWEFSVSPAVTGYGSTVSVLYSASPKYVDTRTGTAYSYIMFQIIQPAECYGESAGYLQLAFSNDGLCWTNPQPATRVGGPWSNCMGRSNTVPMEQVTAFDDGVTSTIKLMGAEGSISYLIDYNHMDETAAVTGASTYANPSNVMLDENKATNAGVFSPSTLDRYSSRLVPYLYFMNLQAAFDPISGDIYVGRAYPYPFDRGPQSAADSQDIWVPLGWQVYETKLMDSTTGKFVHVAGCADWPATLPNRIQLYKMHIGSLSNFAAVGNPWSTWTFLEDLGNASGYTNAVTGSYTPLSYIQTNAGRDYASVSFIRDGAGNLIRESGVARFLAGDTFELSKSNGPCQVTGLERETVLAVP